MNQDPVKSKAADNTWLILLFQVGFFVALFFGAKFLGANVIWVIVGLALLTGLAMFVCFLTLALDGIAREHGFWRKGLMILVAGVIAIVMMYFYSRFS